MLYPEIHEPAYVGRVGLTIEQWQVVSEFAPQTRNKFIRDCKVIDDFIIQCKKHKGKLQ